MLGVLTPRPVLSEVEGINLGAYACDFSDMQSSAQRGGGFGAARDSLYAFSIIADELSQVRALIERELSDCSEPVRGLVACINAGSGKMIRPGLVLLSGLVCGKVTEKHIRAAVIVEMIHNATLLHDDVMDEGATRRGAPTLNSMKGNESAVLLGDFLLSRVFRLCAEMEEPLAKKIASAAVQTCEGEIRQIAQRGNWELREPEYIEIISEKTAALFRTACELGATLAGAGEAQIKMLGDYGHNTGIAFQITDDLLDLTGDPDKTGKSLCSDVDHNKPTLLLIHLFSTADDARKETIKQILIQRSAQEANNPGAEYDRTALLEKLRTFGSIAYSKRRAQEFVDKAIAAIAGLKKSRAKDALTQTAKFAGERVS